MLMAWHAYYARVREVGPCVSEKQDVMPNGWSEWLVCDDVQHCSIYPNIQLEVC